MAADPAWLAPALAVGTAIGAGITAIWAGRKAPSAQGGEATIAGALVDASSIKKLTQAVEDASGLYHRDVTKLVEATEDFSRAQRDVAEAVRDNTEAVKGASDASLNLTRFMEGRTK